QAVFEAMKQIGSELEIENLIPRVFSQLQRLFPCRRVRMFIFDSSASRIVQGFRSSSDQEGNTTAESFETSGGASEIFIDRSDGNVDEISSTINLPLTANSTEVGLLCIDFSELFKLSNFAVEALRAIAGHIGSAVANARRYEREKRRNAQQLMMNEL